MVKCSKKYMDIVNWIDKEIKSGHLCRGDKLASENELSNKFSVSRQTVRHAIELLTIEGKLTRIQGSGTYIGSGTGKPVRLVKYHNIAVVSSYFDSYIFPNIIKGLEKELSNQGYSMQLSITDNKVDKEREILSKLLKNDNVDAIAVEPVKSALPNPNLSYYNQLANKGIPILFFNCYYQNLHFPYVSLNDQKIGKDATQYLIDQGHTKIAGVFKSDDYQGDLRYAGYVESLRENNLPLADHHVMWIDTTFLKNFDKYAELIMDRIDKCTAVFCYNDEVAYALYDILIKNGKRVPEDVSLVGVDDSEQSSAPDIAITSFPHPKSDMGKKIGENIVKMIENPDFDGNFLFTARVKIKNSVKDISSKRESRVTYE